MALGIDRRIIHLLAHSSQPAEVMVLSEQLLKAAAFFPFGDHYDLDLLQDCVAHLGGLSGRQFLSFHAADSKKFAGQCSAKSALALLFLPQGTFMHTRWAENLSHRTLQTSNGCA